MNLGTYSIVKMLSSKLVTMMWRNLIVCVKVLGVVFCGNCSLISNM